MLSIAKFFERIQNIHAKEAFVRSAVQSAIKKHVSVEVPLESIAIKSSEVSLTNVSQSLRSAIFIKKEPILKEINELQALRVIADIR